VWITPDDGRKLGVEWVLYCVNTALHEDWENKLRTSFVKLHISFAVMLIHGWCMSLTWTTKIHLHFVLLNAPVPVVRQLRRGSAAAHLLELPVRILSGTWISVCCDFCVLLGRVFCDWSLVQRSPTECKVCVCVTDCVQMQQ